MRGYLILSLSKIDVSSSLRVDGESLIWVHNHTEESRISIDQFGLVSNLQIMEDRCIIKIGQIRHVFTFLELWRIALSKFFILKDFFLNKKTNQCGNVFCLSNFNTGS